MAVIQEGEAPYQRPDGNLYYIKLKTDQGVFYKIGFTSKDNVKERFSYEGDITHEMISEILFFKYFSNAYELEQKLHSKFKGRRCYEHNRFYNSRVREKNARLPLQNNGVSELYYEDVLCLDPDYSIDNAEVTRQVIDPPVNKAAIGVLNIISMLFAAVYYAMGTVIFSLGALIQVIYKVVYKMFDIREYDSEACGKYGACNKPIMRIFPKRLNVDDVFYNPNKDKEITGTGCFNLNEFLLKEKNKERTASKKAKLLAELEEKYGG